MGYGMENRIWQIVSSPGSEGPDRQGPETKPPQKDARPDGQHGPGETGRPKNQETAAPPRGAARAGPAAPGTDTTGPTMHFAGKRACRQAAGTGRAMLAISISYTLPLVCQVNKGTRTL